MKNIPSQDPLQRDIRGWSNTSEKGQGHSQPKGNGKGKGNGKRKHPGKGNHNQDQAGSLNEDGQRTLGDFGFKRQRVEFVGDDWIEQLMWFAFKSARVLRWIRRNCQVRRRQCGVVCVCVCSVCVCCVCVRCGVLCVVVLCAMCGTND